MIFLFTISEAITVLSADTPHVQKGLLRRGGNGKTENTKMASTITIKLKYKGGKMGED